MLGQGAEGSGQGNQGGQGGQGEHGTIEMGQLSHHMFEVMQARFDTLFPKSVRPAERAKVRRRDIAYLLICL